MKVTTPEISWHERDPIYSVDIQPGEHTVKRLVSGGVDKFIRVWEIVVDSDGKVGVEFLANLKRHTKAVNVCRFSHDGETLATAGDDSVIIFWKLNKSDPNSYNIFQEDEEDNKENWCVQKVLRGHLEDIYDLCWSADDRFMISGSVDNSAILWDLTKDQKIALLNDHQSFVQGVAWDPKNEFVATLSTDRSCRVYSISSRTCVHNIKKMSLPSTTTNVIDVDDKDNKEQKMKSFRMFHDDTMRSFFRRLTFTPDGELLIVPSGVMETDPVINSTYVFTRHLFTKPSVYLPSPEKVTIAVRCCPTKFQLRQVLREGVEDKSNNNLKEWEKYNTLFELPYRMVFAVATEDSVLLYDTQQKQPFGFITNVHYHQLSDLTWSSDGRYMVVSSTDGYCTLVAFEEGELGVPYVESVHEVVKPESNDVNAMSVEEEKLYCVNATSVKEEKVFDEKDDITMETDQSNDDIHLVLDASNDGCEVKKEENSNSQTRLEPKPLEMKVKTVDGKPKRVQITTLSSISSGKTAGSKPLEMKVKSADGKPKNVQITTLSSKESVSTEGRKTPEIQVRSTDGKPKKIEITTLATFTSPKSKQHASNTNGSGKSDSEKVKVLSEKSDNTDKADKDLNTSETSCQTSGTKPFEDKPTPKRIQVTTLQLFSSPSASKQNSSHDKDA